VEDTLLAALAFSPLCAPIRRPGQAADPENPGAEKQLEIPGAFSSPEVDTIFMPGNNLRGLDLRAEDVRTGLLITRKIIEKMGDLKIPKEIY